MPVCISSDVNVLLTVNPKLHVVGTLCVMPALRKSAIVLGMLPPPDPPVDAKTRFQPVFSVIVTLLPVTKRFIKLEFNSVDPLPDV